MKTFIKKNLTLKTLGLFFIGFTFMGCGGNDEPSLVTSYQIINNVSKQITSDVYLDGTMWEIVVFKYRGDDVAGEDIVDPVRPEGDESKIIEVDSEITKVKISFKFLPKESSNYNLPINYRRYYVSYNFLTPKMNNIITLEESTMLTDSRNKRKNIKSALNSIKISDARLE